MAISPTAEGFRAAFRRPSLTFGEIMWRWAVGATAATLFLFGLFQYLNTLPVTDNERLFLRTRQPFLIAQTIAHILHGSLDRAVMAALVAALMLGALWIVAASIGRIATVRALLDYFHRDVAGYVSAGGISNSGERDVASNVSTSSVMRLNFLRAVVALAAILGFLGAMIVAGLASSSAHPRPGVVFLVLPPMVGLVCSGLERAQLASLLGGAVCGSGWRGHHERDFRGSRFLSRADRASVRSQQLDGTRAHGGFRECFDRRRDSLRLHASRALAVSGGRDDSYHSGLFRNRGLAVHGAAGGICLHRRDAGGAVKSVTGCTAADASSRIACFPRAGSDYDRPRRTDLE